MIAVTSALGSVAGAGDVSQQVPYFGTTMVHIEAENFTAAPGSAWRAAAWGGDVGYFAATVADTFHSRRAFLHAPAASAAGAVATAEFSVTRAGTYSVLARYETGFRFQQPFTLEIARKPAEPEAGAPLFSRAYGHREAPKVQPFGGCPDLVGQPLYAPNASCPHPGCGQLQAECSQQYGSTEQIVWEGVGTAVPLAVGSYAMTLTGLNSTESGVDPSSVHFCDRNIDAIVLTANQTDVELRLRKEPYLPLDGLMSQAGEVFFKVENTGGEAFNLSVPYTYIHSPFFGAHMVMPVSAQPGNLSATVQAGCDWTRGAHGPLCPTITAPAMGASEWVDVGWLMDTFNRERNELAPALRSL